MTFSADTAPLAARPPFVAPFGDRLYPTLAQLNDARRDADRRDAAVVAAAQAG